MINENEVVFNASSQEALNQVLLEILTEAKSLEQTPQIIDEFIRLTIISNSIKIGFYLLIVGMVIYFNKKFFNFCKANEDFWEFYIGKSIICLIFFIVGYNLCVSQTILELLKAVLAPKVFLIESLFTKISYSKSPF